ncbi:MAG: hypothetical protein M1822_008806 [Bathelium mastoideum]|nr:MAG: hypothetical protein M1822_008806 [Bathelium mastoideum]
MKRNIAIFLIIIILFIVLTLVGFLIYYVLNGYSFSRAQSVTSDEDAEELVEETMRLARTEDRPMRPRRRV